MSPHVPTPPGSPRVLQPAGRRQLPREDSDVVIPMPDAPAPDDATVAEAAMRQARRTCTSRLCGRLGRLFANVPGACVATGGRDALFQLTGGLTGHVVRAASISAMGPRGNPAHHPGGALSMGLNLVVGVPFLIYAGYRTGYILANAAPEAWRGDRARGGIRLATFLLFTAVPIGTAAALAATVDAEDDERTAAQLFEFFAFISATNARVLGQIFRDLQNYLALPLMPRATLTDSNGYGMADSPDYTRFHLLRLGLLTSFYACMVMFYRTAGQPTLQEAFGLPVMKRGSFSELLGSNAGLITIAAIVEGIDGILGPLAQRQALRALGGTVTYEPPTGEFGGRFNTREATARSLDTVVVNGFMRASFFFLVDPFAAFAARAPAASAMRLGLQAGGGGPHTASEWRGHIAQRALAEEDRQRREQEMAEFFSEHGVQYHHGVPSEPSAVSQQRSRQVRQPNSENVYDRHPDAVVTWHTSPASQSAWPPSFEQSLNSGGRFRIESDDDLPPPIETPRPSASVSVGITPLHVHMTEPDRTIHRPPPKAPRRPAPRKT